MGRTGEVFDIGKRIALGVTAGAGTGRQVDIHRSRRGAVCGGIGTGAAVERVGAAAAVEQIVAAQPVDGVVARSSGQRVVTGRAVDGAAADGDVDGGGVGAAVAVIDGVGEAVRPVVVGIRRVGDGAVAVVDHAAVGTLRHAGDGEGVEVDVAVVT